jgi:hypothetical protein
VIDGGLVIEERGLEDRDWARYDIAGSASGSCEDVAPPAELTPEEKAEQERKRKLAFNAPKRMKKIEEMIAKAEFGSDAEKLMEITKKKKNEEDGVAKLMVEWESLDVCMADMNMCAT